MYHLFLTSCLIVITFGVLTSRYGVEKAYWILASIPTIVFLTAMADEYFRGIQQLNHQVLHVAYDGSYALLLIGIILVLRAILKRKMIAAMVTGSFIAGIPLGYIFIAHP